jgi:hypothetical protein
MSIIPQISCIAFCRLEIIHALMEGVASKGIVWHNIPSRKGKNKN